MTDHVRIAEHDPRWIAEFKRERVRVQRALGKRARAIEHIGSTSITGLIAKPVIDFMVAIDDLSDAGDLFALLSELGYEHDERGDFPGRLYFTRTNATGQEVMHLSLTTLGGDYWCDQLAFREALRSDSDAARRYADLKRALVERFGSDGARYTRAKTEFVRRTLLEAGHVPRSGWAGELPRRARH